MKPSAREIYRTLREEFSNALDRFSEVLEERKSEIVRDAAVKRFEFTYELAWKTLKAYLQSTGFDTNSPRATFQEAYKNNLLSDETPFLNMIAVRNPSSHEYGQEEVEDIYRQLPGVYASLREVHNTLVSIEQESTNTHERTSP